jgi:hypothetical protein
LLAGWLRSRLEREVELEHEQADNLTVVAVDGEPCHTREDQPNASELLSSELDEYCRDEVYEAAARAASA